MTGSCGKITLGNREDLQTNQNEEPITVTVFDNQYFVDLSNCDGQRKFVCQMSSVSTQLSPSKYIRFLKNIYIRDVVWL